MKPWLLQFYSCDMKITQVVHPEMAADGGFLLNDVLRPVWIFLFYNGVFPKFYHQTTENRTIYAARCAVTAIVVLYFSLYTLFLCIQFIVWFQSGTRLMDIVMIMYVLVTFSSALFFQCHHLIYHKELIQFFKDWKKIEIDSLTKSSRIKKRVAKIMFAVNGTFVFANAAVGFIFNRTDPNEVIFLTYYSYISESLNINFVSFIMGLGWYFSQLYASLGEIVPTAFFYHAGCIIEDLQQQLLDTSITGSDLYHNAMVSNLYVQFKNDQPYRHIWEKYETVLGCVKQGNKLFQSSILCLHSSLFMIICLGVYFISNLYHLKVDKLLASSFYFITSLTTLRTIAVFRLMSHPYSSREKLRRTIAEILSSKWDSLPEEDRQLLVAFQERLGSENMAAMPYDLYTVSPSNLLSMFSLIVTYVVVLFQIQP